MSKILSVEKNSPCAGRIFPGDELLTVNGHKIKDVLDYMFYTADETLKVAIRDRAGRCKLLLVKKERYEELGLEFENLLMDQLKSCHNKCIFCFIDQLPKGMRETLYFKDDDSRMSFLRGNYITLTNLSDDDIGRIIDLKISPINVSVHTTEPGLRIQMMHNKNAGKCYEILKRLTGAGISINCQIVLCRGVNDGAHLDRTLQDLLALGEPVGSIAVVPAGLTKYREGLYPLQNFSQEEAAQVMMQIDRFGDQMEQERGVRMVYPADEFFIKAQQDIPQEEYYGAFAQLENGVGMLSIFQGQFFEALEELQSSEKRRKLLLATGVAAHPFLCKLVDALQKKWNNLECNVLRIENRFFGDQITVAGLVAGQDLCRALDEALAEGEVDGILFPDAMLRFENDRFLDDITLEEIQERYPCPVYPVESGGEALLRALCGNG